MKIKCNFCNTEYEVASNTSGHVKCAVCGNVWNIKKPTNKNAILVLLSSVCALLAAIIFTVVVIVNYQANNAKNKPLVADIESVQPVYDEAGIPHFVVSGIITNNSDKIYGMPDMVIISYDADGKVVARQKVLPPATLLDAGKTIKFTQSLSVDANRVKKVSIELLNQNI